MRKLLYVVVLIVVVSGCSSNKEQVSDKEHYADDGYMGLTNANPSLLTSPNARNYATDMKVMKRALSAVPNIRKSRIIIDGGFAYIHILVARGLSREETKNVSNQAQRQLSKMSPQYYKIRITVEQ